MPHLQLSPLTQPLDCRVTIRVPNALYTQIEVYAMANGIYSISDAFRQLVHRGLEVSK